MGIDKYNAECRSIVMKYAGEWRQTVERMGRWIDFDDDYKTLNTSFMESVWWAFGELFKKGMVYRGLKVMPYSTGCTTPLSNFEASSDYRDVSDPASKIYHEYLFMTRQIQRIYIQSPFHSLSSMIPVRHSWHGPLHPGRSHQISPFVSTPISITLRSMIRNEIRTSSSTRIS